jgi:hypothetical protein
MGNKQSAKWRDVARIASSRKGQLAFEFMLIYSFFILVFVAALFVISQRSAEQQLYAEGMFAKEVAMRFSDEIRIASVIPGYEKNYSFPRTMRSVPYGVRISNGLLELNYSVGREISVIYPLATSDVTLNVSGIATTSFSLNTTKGWAVISNENGRVVITQ